MHLLVQIFSCFSSLLGWVILCGVAMHAIRSFTILLQLHDVLLQETAPGRFVHEDLT